MMKIAPVDDVQSELKQLTDTELERQMAELQKEANRRVKAKEDEKIKADNVLKNLVIDNFLKVLREMHDFKLLPEELETLYTTGAGFQPHLRHRKLKV